MQVKEDRCPRRSSDDQPARQAPDAANAIKWGAEGAVTSRDLVAMTAQTLANNVDMLSFALGMQFVAHMTTAALAAILVDTVRGTRQ